MSKVNGYVLRGVRAVKGTTHTVLCLSVAVLVPLLMFGCVSSAPPTRSDPFVGTWLSDSYYGTWEYTHTSDGRMLVYVRSDPSHPYMTARYQVDKKWRDAKGDYLYDVRSLWGTVSADKGPAVTWYSTIRIDPTGNKLEEYTDENGYVDPSQMKFLWQTFHRVK